MLELCALFVTLGTVLSEGMQYDLVSIGVVSLVIGFICWRWARNAAGIAFGALVAASVLLGALMLGLRGSVPPPGLFGSRAFEARVISIDRQLARTNLVVRETDYGEKVELFLRERSGYLPGDRVSVRAAVEHPESFVTDAGRIFDYPRYLESRGIVAVARDPEVRLQTRGNMSLQRMATLLRFRIADVFSRYLSFPIDGVVAGMTVGYQGGLPKSIQELFRVTGVLHVLVLSGYNITLLAGALGLVLRRVPFRLRTFLSIAAIALLVVVSGSGVASVRAGIMGTIALGAGLSVRTYQPLRALTIAYLFFFFLSPQALVADPGLHLSFLATACMILVIPKVSHLFSWVPRTRGVDLHELLILALVVPLFMLPYTMYFSGVFPLASPIANIVLAIATPVLMVLGIAVVLTAWIAPVATILGAIVSALGTVVLRLLEVLSKLPVWTMPEIPWWSVMLLYALLFGALFRSEIMQYGRQFRSSLAPASSRAGS